jgi:predicted DNA binding CopG/RHH family protein
MEKNFPIFQNDQEIEDFMEQDLSDYIHAGNFSPVQFEFLPKDAKINMRLPVSLLENIKQTAKQQGISYQRYIRMTLENALHHQNQRVP